jgi:sec-independent protein translocase protein TatA
MNTLFAFGFGPWEMGAIVVIAMLLFGTRIPSVMRSMGQGITEFKKGIKESEDETAGESQK